MLQSAQDDFSRSTREVLNERESDLVGGLDRAYVRRTGKVPQSNLNLVYFLGDSLAWKAWSAANQRIPTFRRQSGLFLQRATWRLLTPYDKLAAQGWPMSEEVARAMGVTKFPCLDLSRADSHVGNAMHMSNCALLVLLGLSCFGKQ